VLVVLDESFWHVLAWNTRFTGNRQTRSTRADIVDCCLFYQLLFFVILVETRRLLWT